MSVLIKIKSKIEDFKKYVDESMSSHKQKSNSGNYSAEFINKSLIEMELLVEQRGIHVLEEVRNIIDEEKKSIFENVLEKTQDQLLYSKSTCQEVREIKVISVLEALQDSVSSIEIEAIAAEFKDNYMMTKYLCDFAKRFDKAIPVVFNSIDKKFNDIEKIFNVAKGTLTQAHPIRENSEFNIAISFFLERINEMSVKAYSQIDIINEAGAASDFNKGLMNSYKFA